MNVFAPTQLKFLEKVLESGSYRSRSEIVRDFIRRAEFEWQWKSAIALCKNKKIDVDAERKKVSKKLLKRFGD
ncbi:hypothetical protein COT30_03885 [Candidatus Micrarchaeota archaeon CG08_land_8_20_14_0_20_49_17]|nr:MAG: hypothetical protein AUJ13_04465 [Candidatus Micrarchaeota archaeon CG1_02_49_24]PIU09535.1 MAG: hypothetical protein COT30_03885 [Candidatus Micrarchaeota archaeon CG08_land_8_20_14_0_20_49_17]PIU81642.1 MAG: hypothetical protein COS70_02995 [Candidatus Micrarchaeota archaeon CG06_land_8_20_14_3_00_50_6]PIZ97581.1 MAG: hypothetical protein COX84_03020 [Candidatus Micrarchaeota archaeon CG_4_10_14_0_2_um_filter_49_7]HII54344.1 hypothetical protein [Candidatus Micrarchaeota archaeon]